MKTKLITLAILITCAILSLLFIGCSGIYFTWIYEPDIATEIDTETLAIFTEVYKWHMQVENWEYQQGAVHIDSLIQREAIK